jgi:uncharacterized protein (UPF0335 family)
MAESVSAEEINVGGVAAEPNRRPRMNSIAAKRIGRGATESEANPVETGGIAADRLRSLIERIERLEEERKALGSDIKDIYAEAKSAGFDVKVIRQLISIRRKEPAEVEEQETLLDVYRRALGM